MNKIRREAARHLLLFHAYLLLGAVAKSFCNGPCCCSLGTVIFQLFARNFCVISSIWMRKNSFFHIHSKDTKIGILCADRLIFTRFYSFPTRINAKKPTLHRNARWVITLLDWMIDWIAVFAKITQMRLVRNHSITLRYYYITIQVFRQGNYTPI